MSIDCGGCPNVVVSKDRTSPIMTMRDEGIVRIDFETRPK
jgi:hypothetical protein